MRISSIRLTVIKMRKARIKIADNMSDETYCMLCDGIKEKFGSDVEFEKITDNSVIGGFTLSLDGVIYDNSLRTQLKRLKKHIAN